MATEPEKPRSLEYGLGLLILLGIFAAGALWQKAKTQKYRSANALYQAENNLRQIRLPIFKFVKQFGTYPNDHTKKIVKSRHGSAIPLDGKSSNAAFRQLFACEAVETEAPFYAKIAGSKETTGNNMGENLLNSGEVGFSYISGLLTSDSPLTPIVLTPLIPGTTKFDPKPFDGKAIVLHIDGSVRTYDIHKDGHIYDKGINLLSPKHPIWKGKAPDIRYPE